mmetsp:Transcript_23197/g.64835  ORF Transcript_23197/g.64835 Transcript_23197/m.64835 type:complete len:223 (+) Transcript_23197:558-1226(+)
MTSRRLKLTYSRHMSTHSRSCFSSLWSSATERGTVWRMLRKSDSASLNFPSVVTWRASFTRSKMFSFPYKTIGARSLCLALPSESSGHWIEGAHGNPGNEEHVAQYAALKRGSSGSALITPKRRFKRSNASSKSPAATRSAGSFRLRNHLAWQESPTTTPVGAASSTAGRATSSRSNSSQSAWRLSLRSSSSRHGFVSSGFSTASSNTGWSLMNPWPGVGTF